MAVKFFYFVLMLHYLVPGVAYSLGGALRRSSLGYDFTPIVPEIISVLVLFVIACEVARKWSRVYIERNHKYSRLFCLDKRFFRFYSVVYLLFTFSLRVTLGNGDGFYWVQSAFNVNFPLLLINLSISRKHYWRTVILYTPFLLANGSKGDPVWIFLIVLFTYQAHFNYSTVQLARKLGPFFLVAASLLLFQIITRGEMAEGVLATLFRVVFLRNYGLEGFGIYLIDGPKYNLAHAEFSAILPFIEGAVPRPGVEFSYHYYTADYDWGGGESSMYRSIFIVPYYSMGLLGVALLGLIFGVVLRLTQATNTGGFLRIFSIFTVTMSVSILNGAWSFVIINLIASAIVILVYLTLESLLRRRIRV